MDSETRTLTYTPADVDDDHADEITPEWLAGVAEGIEEEDEDLTGDVRITRVELTVEVPDE